MTVRKPTVARSTDTEYYLNKHLGLLIGLGVHLQATYKCQAKLLTDINRDLPFKYKLTFGPTNGKVLQDLYSLWLSLGCGEMLPDQPWAWRLYQDLKDREDTGFEKIFAAKVRNRRRGRRRA
jgi:hypothetical protein